MTTLWALHPTALPQWSQLEKDEKLWFLWGERPASHLTYTMTQTKANDPQEKPRVRVLYCTQKYCSVFCWMGLQQSNPRVQGCHSPFCKQDWWGKEGQGGKQVPFGYYSLRVKPCLTEQPAPQTPKCVRLKLHAANQCKYYLFLLFGEIMPTSLEGWEQRQHSQPKHGGVGVE